MGGAESAHPKAPTASTSVRPGSLDPIRPFAPSIREGDNLSLRPSWPVLQFFDKIDHHVQGLPEMESIAIVDRKYVPRLLKMIFHKNIRSIHLFLR